MARNNKGIVLLGLACGLALFFVAERSLIRGVSSPASPPKNLYLLQAVAQHIRNDYLEVKEPFPTFEGSFRGLVNSLDSYSCYLNKENTARFQSQRTALSREPGAFVYKKYDTFPLVVGLHEESPAEKSGLQLGDLITEINGLDTPAMSLTEFNLQLKGQEETPVDLKVLRGEKTLELKVARSLLAPEPAAYSSLEGTAGVLRIARIEAACVIAIKSKLLPDLKKKKRFLIIDLRNCQEGAFEEAGPLVSLFAKAESAGYLERKGGTKEKLSSSDEPALPELPLVVWVNQATIGPAEAVAALLQESKRAKIVGLPTLGLAAKYEFFPLQDGSSLLLTTGVFCLNSGEKLWGRGVVPDAEVDSADQSSAAYLKKTKDILSSP